MMLRWLYSRSENLLKQRSPYIEFEKAFEKAEEERLADPGPEDSTEFDPERHAQQKGSIRPGQQALRNRKYLSNLEG